MIALYHSMHCVIANRVQAPNLHTITCTFELIREYQDLPMSLAVTLIFIANCIQQVKLQISPEIKASVKV